MKKNIFIILAVGLSLFISGCMNNTKATEVEKKEVKAAAIEEANEDTGKKYEEILTVLQGALGEIDDNQKEDAMAYIKRFTENMPILKEMNTKAKKYCGNEFYVELHTTDHIDKDFNGISKRFFKDGNYREEEYVNNKLVYVTIYNESEDTLYLYDVEGNKLQKTPKYGNHYDRKYPYMDAEHFFDGDNNAQVGKMKYIEEQGKKVLYSEYTHMDEGCKEETKYWFDADTGILLKESEKMYIDNKLKVDYDAECIIDVNKKIDNDLFSGQTIKK